MEETQMTQTTTATTSAGRTTASRTDSNAGAARTGARNLMAAGLVAGPLYCLTGIAQALSRDGFDVTRHPLSLLSNGDLGWVQITNFVLCGLLVVAGAVGLRRTGRAGTWAPRLIAAYGVGLVAAGAFVADPMDGFPFGTAAGPPAAVSWHGLLHLVAGAVGFTAFVAACFVLARRFARTGQRGRARYSAATGVAFGAAFVGIASGSTAAAVVLAFYVAVALGWTWLIVTMAWYRQAAA
jgi:hypothetical protein